MSKEIHQLSLFSNAPARRPAVAQCEESVPVVAEPFEFYATFGVDSLCSYIPQQVAVLLPASSWARKGLQPPRLPAHIHARGADSGGFVASRIWGEYRYSLEQYVNWLLSWRPLSAATMEYCCEPELAVVTRERQDRTTDNARQAWEQFRQLPFAWVPTIQGWLPEDYQRHAYELKPLIEDMAAYYATNPHWRVGVGTLCRRNDATMVQAILNAIREVLPGVPLHVWGIKLDALRSINLAQVVSTDSAAWHGHFHQEREAIRQQAAAQGISMRRYAVEVNLPRYLAKVHAAVAESRQVTTLQHDTELLEQARHLLHTHGGWTLDLLVRRNRTYAYAVRRVGKRLERRYLCAVARLPVWLTSSASVAVLQHEESAQVVAEQRGNALACC